jgi:hypothetical protein
MKSLILILFACIYTCIAEAQAPRKIPYQAVARNNQGDPIANQNISVRFQIQDSLLNTLFQEDQQTSTNTLGLFQLQIGTITPLNIDWTGGTRFLKVSVDISGGNNYIDLGTSPFLSVPYALYAEQSGTPSPPITVSNIEIIDGQLTFSFSDGSTQSVTMPASYSVKNNKTLIYTTNGF